MLAVPPRSEVRSRPLETKRLLLSPLDATDTRDLWSAVESSRPQLEPWLPWVPFNVDLDSSGRYAEASASDWDAARASLLGIPGIGPWTAEMIAMRGLGDPDAFPVTDLGVAAAAKQVGLPSDPRPLAVRSSAWRPWRSYATQHLWTVLDHSVNQWPPKEK